MMLDCLQAGILEFISPVPHNSQSVAYLCRIGLFHDVTDTQWQQAETTSAHDTVAPRFHSVTETSRMLH